MAPVISKLQDIISLSSANVEGDHTNEGTFLANDIGKAPLYGSYPDKLTVENMQIMTNAPSAGDEEVTTAAATNTTASDVELESPPQCQGNDSSLNFPITISKPSSHKLNLVQLAILVFYNVSGGPFGIEPSIRAGGNMYTILGFILFPFVWSLPEALVTAELGSAFPSSSGGVIWVENAFGQTAGAFCGYMSYISGAVDNAIYPTLFLSYLSDGGASFEGMTKFVYASGLSILLAGLNYLGLEIVGNASVLVCIIAMSPFVIMTFLGISQVEISRWFTLPVDDAEDANLFDDAFETAPGPLPLVTMGILVRPFLNNMFWNLNSFDAAANFAAEVRSVDTTYPRGIFVGLGLCFVFYLVPLLIATGATDYEQKDWVDGHLSNVARDIGGEWLGAWTIFAVGISNLSLFEAEMSADAYQLMGMAEQGYLPKLFKKRSRFGTPTAGIVTATFIIVALSVADFSQLVEFLNVAYAISLSMEYAAFVKLRKDQPYIHRPYRIPVPDWASFLVVLPPCIGIFVLFAVSSWMTYVFVAGILVLCLMLLLLQRTAMERGWCKFEVGVDDEYYDNVRQQVVDEDDQDIPENDSDDDFQIV